jgi:hydroxymethylglutaryl-CoA lyase
MVADIIELFENAASDKTITRIALTARGKFFCTGMDLGPNTTVARDNKTSNDQFDRFTQLFEAISKAPQVTIAAVNGPAFGGGVGLAFACDIRIGTANANFTLSEVKLGLAPATISKYVIKEWGSAFTREAMLSGRPVPFSQLLSLGLVARLVEEKKGLDKALDQYLLQLRAAAPRASTLVKDLVRASKHGTTKEAQAASIKRIFKEMMSPGAESTHGLREFQAGRRDINWDAFVLGDLKGKL